MIVSFPRKIDESMVNVFITAQEQLIFELYEAVTKGKSYDYLKKRLDLITTELQNKYGVYASISTNEHYLDGTLNYGKEPETYLKEVGGKTTNLTLAEREIESGKLLLQLGGINPPVVEALIKQGNEYLEQATNNSLKGILGTYSQARKEGIFKTLGVSEALGDSTFKSREALTKYLTKKGVGSITDKAGRKRTLQRYSEMLVRTETGKATNMGILTRGKEVGVTKFRRIERAACCDICARRRGEIVDISNGFPYLLLHPNCLGYWDPILKNIK